MLDDLFKNKAQQMIAHLQVHVASVEGLMHLSVYIPHETTP